MNATLEDLQKKAGELAALERQALEHEQAARECRAKRSELKQEIAEIRSTINDAAIVRAATGSAQSAEKARIEAEAVVASLREKEKQLDALIAKAKTDGS